MGIAAVALVRLPPAVQHTLERVTQGGPFRYSKDGAVFMNRERRLPRQPRGYYREYTIETPGAHDRGARRLVCGGASLRAPDACYYTADHYTSFRLVLR
ncbi:MAG: ribonuclease domain-containing protein [Rubrivivax sp.]